MEVVGYVLAAAVVVFIGYRMFGRKLLDGKFFRSEGCKCNPCECNK